MHQRASAGRLAALLATVLAAACASVAFEPDRNARAPRLEGFGTRATTAYAVAPAARELFEQGLALAWAFNHREAVRTFKAALAADPRCAICAWAVAWQLGPNINGRQRGDLREAMQHLDVAVRLSAAASPHERALIDAMAVRYGHASQARETAPMAAAVCGAPTSEQGRAHPLDVAYADRLQALLQARPDDPDLVVLWVEAAMIANPSLSWPQAGGPAPKPLLERVETLERALRQHPAHTGLNHYLIHAADHPSVAQRAVPAAERIGSLAPGAPHLVHMPAHTFAHVGRYADAARVNEQALQAEQAYHAQARQQGFVPMDDWRYHNQHFLWFAELMQGRGDAALAAARRNVELFGRGNDPYLEYVRSLPLLTLVRLERWQAVLVEPAPAGGSGIAQSVHLSARGVALARLGRLEEAKSALEQLETHVEGVREGKTTRPGQVPPFVRAAADLSLGLLQAEVAAAEGRWDTAEVRLEQALRASMPFDAYEPAMFGAGMRVALGEVLVRAGKPERAEMVFRRELVDRPESGWALRGLVQAARARQQTDVADRTGRLLDVAWASADSTLRPAR